MLKTPNESDCARLSESSSKGVISWNRTRTLARKCVASFMSLVMAIGLMPLPAYAGTSSSSLAAGMTAGRSTQSSESLAVQSGEQTEASAAYAVYDGGVLSFVRSSDASLSNQTTLGEGVSLTSVSGLVFNSGTVYAGFEDSGSAPWNVDTVKKAVTTVRFIDPIAPSGSCAGWFQGFDVLTSVEYPDNFNASNVTSLENMFSGCGLLSSLDLSSWDVFEVTSTKAMFKECEKLVSLDVSNWNLGASDMEEMFYGCLSLGYLDLNGFNTSNASMETMFYNCSGLRALRLGDDFSFYGGTVTYASEPLCGLDSNVGTWYRVDGEYKDKASGTEAGSLAADYNRLSADMSGLWRQGSYSGGSVYATFDSENATLSFVRAKDKPSGAYDVDTSYKGSAEVPKWCSDLATKVRAVRFDVAVKPMSTAHWFSGLTALETVDLRALDTSETENMEGMFEGCTNLRSIEGLDLLNTKSVNSMDSMFSGCSSLVELDLSGEGFDTRKSTMTMSDMLKDCSNLNQVKLGALFRFNSGCQLPAIEKGDGRSGLWAARGAYSSDQLSAEDLASIYPGANRDYVGTWVRGNALTYTVNYYSGGVLVETSKLSVFESYDLIDVSNYPSAAGFSEACGWTESSSSAQNIVSSYASKEVEPGEVRNLYSVWARDVSVHAGNPAETRSVRQYCNNGSSDPVYYSSIEASFFRDIDGWDAYGWSDSADTLAVPDSLRFSSDATVYYDGESCDLYAVYVRDIAFEYDANIKGRGDEIPASVLPKGTTQKQFFIAGSQQPTTVFFSDVSKQKLIMKGYKFEGWAGADGATAAEVISETNPLVINRGIAASEAANPVILYAIWEANTYKDTFYANDGSTDKAVKERAYGTIADEFVTFTRRGYTQLGWAEQQDATIAAYAVDYRNAISKVASPKNLYAVWQPNEYDIVLDLKGGSMSENEVEGWSKRGDGTFAMDGGYTVLDDVLLPTTGITREGYVLTGWKIVKNGDVGSAIESFSSGTYAEDLKFEAQWSECIPVPQQIKGLVFTGAEQVGMEAGAGYTLESTSSALIDPVTGNAIAKNFGTYSVAAKLKDGYAWSDGTFADKALAFTIGKASIAKVVVSSAAESGQGDPAVEVYVRDGNGELVKFADSAVNESFDKIVSFDADGNPVVTLKGKGDGFVEGGEISSPFEVVESEGAAANRRTEKVVNQDGSSVVKLIEASDGSDSLEKLTVVSAPDEKGIITSVEYNGSGMVADDNGKVTAGATAMTIEKTEYSGAALAKVEEATYEAADGKTLDTAAGDAGAVPSGVAKLTQVTSTYNKDGELADKTTALYEAAKDALLDVAGDAVAGASKLTVTTDHVDGGIVTTTVSAYDAPSGKALAVAVGETGVPIATGAALETTTTTVKTPGATPETVTTGFTSIERAFDDEGKEVGSTEKAYTGNSKTGLTIDGGAVKGASKLVEKQVVSGELGSTTVTTTYQGGDTEETALEISGSEVKGAASVNRFSVESNAEGNVTRVEDVTTTYENGVQTGYSEAVYESAGTSFIELTSDGKIAGNQTPTSQSSSNSQVNEDGSLRSIGTAVEYVDGKKVTSEVVTTIKKNDEDGTYNIVNKVQPLDDNGNKVGDATETALAVSPDKPVEGNPDAIATTVTSGGETIVTERDKETGKVIAVYDANGTIRLTGDALTSISQGGEWIWLSVQRYDADLSNMTLSKVAQGKYDSYKASKLDENGNGYESARCDALNLKLSVLSPTTGTASSRNSGLSDLKAQFMMGEGNGERAAHATHVYSVWDTKSWGDNPAEELKTDLAGVVTLNVSSLNEFVIAVEKKALAVSYETNGGTAIASKYVADGSLAVKPADPSREGYAFDAWYADAELRTPYDFSKQVSSDATLYAGWKGDLSKARVELAAASKVYDGTAFELSAKVTLSDGTLVDAKNYTLKYVNSTKTNAVEQPIDQGTYYVKVEGKEGCTGSNDAAAFTISQAPIKSAAVTLSQTSQTYNGKKFNPTATKVKLGSLTLTKGTDYTLSYLNSKKKAVKAANLKAAGTYYVKLTGKGNFSGTVTKAFTVAKASIAKASVTLSKKSQVYNGKKFNPTAKTVKLGSLTLKKGTDYTLSYLNSKKKAVKAANLKAAGTYYVKLTGKGNYKGTIATVQFKVTKAANPFKVAAKSKQFKASAKKKTILKASKLYKITNDKSKGKRSFKRVSLDKKKYLKKFTVAANGNVTVNKGVKRGTYTLTVKVTVGAKGSLNAQSKNVKLKIKVS